MFSKTLLVSKVNCWPHALTTNSQKLYQPLHSANRVIHDKKWRTLATFNKNDNPDDEGDQPIDIDALAARLAAEAARLTNEANKITGSEDDDSNPLDNAFTFDIFSFLLETTANPKLLRVPELAFFLFYKIKMVRTSFSVLFHFSKFKTSSLVNPY